MGADGEAEPLGDAPIFPVGEDRAKTFSRRLGSAFRRMSSALTPTGMLIFTFHASKDEAWKALGTALRSSDLKVTALYPVWADARAAGAHGHPGNCELDLVFVCRPAGQMPVSAISATAESWTSAFGDSTVGEADTRGMRAALEIARTLADRAP
jgi:adenine-specific DNA methylase